MRKLTPLQREQLRAEKEAAILAAAEKEAVVSVAEKKESKPKKTKDVTEDDDATETKSGDVVEFSTESQEPTE